MHVTMIKKRLADGSVCKKCVQAEELLKRRELWSQVNEVVWAQEDDASSPGMKLAAEHKVEVAPFFIVKDEGKEQVYTSALELIKTRLTKDEGGKSEPKSPFELDEAHVAALNERFSKSQPLEIIDEV